MQLVPQHPHLEWKKIWNLETFMNNSTKLFTMEFSWIPHKK